MLGSTLSQVPHCDLACALMCRDAEGAGVAHLLRLHEGTCGGWEPQQRPGIVITNPPWGNRLMALEYDAPNQLSALEAAWTELGLFLKVRSKIHCNALMLTGSCQPRLAFSSAKGSPDKMLLVCVLMIGQAQGW